MTEYAPEAILSLFAQVQAAIPSAIMSGIIGDPAHTYGYHRGRHYVGSDDYSVQLPEDRGGDGEAACALDISYGNGADHYAVSQRMLDAGAWDDPRMTACREYYGSVDGWTVVGWDYAGGYPVTSDPSHLWHGHWSFDRNTATDHQAMNQIAAVITGGQSQGDDMPLNDDDKRWIQDCVLNIVRAEGVSGAGDTGTMRQRGYDAMVVEMCVSALRSEGVSGAGDTALQLQNTVDIIRAKLDESTPG